MNTRRELDSGDIFRQEALEYKARSPTVPGILEVPVRPSIWLYRLLALLGVTSAMVLATVRVSSEVSAPAIIRATRHNAVRPSKAGIVESILFKTGDWIRAGDPIITLEADDTRHQLLLNDAELRGVAASMLLRPRDRVSQETLVRLTTENAELKRSIESSILRAPNDGILTDLRAQVGQSVSTGESLASISVADSPFEVLAFIPGSSRPEVAVGQSMVLSLGATERKYRELTVSQVDDRAIGPADARRFLGNEVGDTVNISGSVFIVRAVLTQEGVSAANDGYFDGMPARVTIRPLPQRALFVLFPALSALFGEAR